MINSAIMYVIKIYFEFDVGTFIMKFLSSLVRETIAMLATAYFCGMKWRKEANKRSWMINSKWSNLQKNNGNFALMGFSSPSDSIKKGDRSTTIFPFLQNIRCKCGQFVKTMINCLCIVHSDILKRPIS